MPFKKKFIPFDQVILLLKKSIFKKQLKCRQIFIYKDVHHCIIYNNEKLGIASVSNKAGGAIIAQSCMLNYITIKGGDFNLINDMNTFTIKM